MQYEYDAYGNLTSREDGYWSNNEDFDYDNLNRLVSTVWSQSLYYIVRDNLGSIVHVVDSTGLVAQELSYDAWGRLRDPDPQQIYAPSEQPELLLGRGYCGHEHLADFNLINMNTRLYDPWTARFLSPDQYVQLPDFTQSLNRYSYYLNNPLKYVDIQLNFNIVNRLSCGLG